MIKKRRTHGWTTCRWTPLLLSTIPLLLTTPTQAGDTQNCPWSCSGSTFPGQFYLDFSVGHANGKGSADFFNQRFSDAGLDASLLDYDDDRFGWQINVGMHIVQYVAFELHYVDLEDAEVRIGADEATFGAANTAIDEVAPLFDQGWGVALAAHIPLGEQWRGLVKLGEHRWKGENGRELTTDHFYSVGIDFPLALDIRLVGEVTRYEMTQMHTIFSSFGVRYYF